MVNLKQISDDLKTYSQVTFCTITHQDGEYCLDIKIIGKSRTKKCFTSEIDLVDYCKKIRSDLQDEELDYYDK